MSITTRLHIRQAFEIEGVELDERLPPIIEGLIAYFPMDGSTTGLAPFSNVIDSDNQWVNGTSGSQGIYSKNGQEPDRIIHKPNPWGVMSDIWAVESNDIGNDGDGGWNVTDVSIDHTKTYRYSVWIRKENAGNGRAYFGCQGNTVWNLGTTTVNSNPYFFNARNADVTQDEIWLLWVGFVHASDYSGTTHTDSGLYNLAGTKVATSTDYKWISGQEIGGHRAYQYYSTTVDERQYFYDPVMEIYQDSVSSTITDLLNGNTDLLHPTVSTNVSISSEERIGVITAGVSTTNDVVNPTGDLGAGIPGDYTPGWDNSLHPTASTVSTWSDGINVGVTDPSHGYHAQWVPEGAYGGWCVKMIDRNDIWGQPHRWMGISQNLGSPTSKGWVAGDVLMVSWDQKVDDIDKPGRVGMYHYESAVVGFYDEIINKYNTIPNRWERKFVLFDTTGWDFGSTCSLYMYGNQGTYATVWYDNWQIINVAGATYANGYHAPFVDGTAVNTNLTMELPISPYEYTVTGKFMPYTPLSDTTYNESTLNNSALFQVYSGPPEYGHMYFNTYISGGFASPFLNPDGSFGTTHKHQNYTIDVSDNLANEVTYAITKTGTTFNFKMNQHGTWKPTHTSTLPYDISMDQFRLGMGETCWNGTHRDIAIYDRVLSDTELDIMSKPTIVLDNSTYRTNINEINPNIWNNPVLESITYDVGSNGTVTLETDVSEGTYHEMILSSVASVYRGYDISTNNGDTYIFSGMFWQSDGNTFTYKPISIENATSIIGYDYADWSSAPINEWFYASGSCVADWYVRFLVYPNSAAGSGTVRWRNLTVRKAANPDMAFDEDVLLVGELLFPPISSLNYDPDAAIFINAAAITDNNQKVAINNLVLTLKSDGIWTKFYAIWPMVGGTATTHKYNLLDPQDTDGAFRLTWTGGWTHSSTGALPNGTTGYAHTHFVPNTHFDETDYQGWGYYSRTSTGDSDEYVMGSAMSGTRAHTLIIRRTTDIGYTHSDTVTGSYRLAQGTVTNGAAFFHSSQDGTNIVLRRNTTQVATNGTAGSNTPGTQYMVLGAINNAGTLGQWTNKECALAYISHFLTQTEQSDLTTAVETYQTALSRNV